MNCKSKFETRRNNWLNSCMFGAICPKIGELIQFVLGTRMEEAGRNKSNRALLSPNL